MENLRSKFHYAYVIVFCCCLIMGVLVGLVMSSAGIFYKPISTELGISVGDFGLYMTFIYGFSFLILSFAGKLMEKFSARWLLTVCSAVVGLAYLAMAQFIAVWQFYFAGAVLGVVFAFILYLSYPVLINRWFTANVGFFMGICSSASGIGGIIFNPLGGYLLREFGWRNTYLIFGAGIILVLTPILALLLRDFPKDKNLLPFGGSLKIEDAPKSGADYQIAKKSPVFFALWVFAFLMISISTLNLLLPTYFTSLGYSLKQVSMVASVIMIGVTVGKVALGWINDKNTLAGVLTGVIFGILGFILLLFGKLGIIYLLIGGFLYGWAYAAVFVETALLVRTVFGAKDYSKIYSGISVALALGGTIMAGTWGYLSDYIDFKYIIGIAIFILVIIGILGSYALKFGKKL